MFVLAVAALCHDMDHPGVTNAFLINTSDHLALLYNDSSVLENHHVSSLFRLFAQKPAVNVLSRCDRETLKGIRKILLEVVLHTDMSKHFGMVSKAELFAELHMGTIALAARGDPGAAQRLWTKGEDRTFAMALLLHAADVSNPAVRALVPGAQGGPAAGAHGPRLARTPLTPSLTPLPTPPPTPTHGRNPWRSRRSGRTR